MPNAVPICGEQLLDEPLDLGPGAEHGAGGCPAPLAAQDLTSPPKDRETKGDTNERKRFKHCAATSRQPGTEERQQDTSAAERR